MKRAFLAGVALLAAVSGSAISGSAMAADMSTAPVLTKASPMGPTSWTGCYVGGEGGYAYGQSKHTAESGIAAGLDITPTFNLNGEIAGGTFGCNYQTSNFVLGIEDDLSWTNKKGSASDQLPFNAFTISATNEKWIDTLRGRAGFAWERVFLFATGGGAVANIGVNICNTALATCVSDSSNVWGWTFGVGIEWTAWDNWSFKAEYLHVDFGAPQFINPPVVVPGIANIVTRHDAVTDELFRVGVNYRILGGASVASRY
jgi:outer membrane immunogenic protein